MTTWVALLRGVNVNGRVIRSADLAELFRGLGFDVVRTVLASGNVRFECDAAPTARAALKLRIEQALRDRFGYDAWIVLVTLHELRAAIEGFPFDSDDADRHPYVVFASDAATITELAAEGTALSVHADPLAAGTAVLYWCPVKGTTVDTAFGKLLGKARYTRSTTTRNLRTLVKIAG